MRMKGSIEQGDPWMDRLSAYLDDDLAAGERQAFEEHLAGCADCAAALDALREVVARATGLNRPTEPSSDLWPGIAKRLTPRRAHAPGSWLPASLGWLQPRIAAAALVIACLAILWLLHLRSGPPVRQVAGRPSPAPAVLNDSGTEREYDKTVANLHRQARDRLTLDPHLVEVIDENLATLDAAIASYRDALAAEPGDAQLRRRLDAARQRKLEVLQQAVALAIEGTE
jgi:anti-sigma factor RsiW